MASIFEREDWFDVLAEFKERRRLEIEAAETAEARRPRAPEPPPALRSWHLPAVAARILDVGSDPDPGTTGSLPT
jgi:hypothetical protein